MSEQGGGSDASSSTRAASSDDGGVNPQGFDRVVLRLLQKFPTLDVLRINAPDIVAAIEAGARAGAKWSPLLKSLGLLRRRRRPVADVIEGVLRECPVVDIDRLLRPRALRAVVDLVDGGASPARAARLLQIAVERPVVDRPSRRSPLAEALHAVAELAVSDSVMADEPGDYTWSMESAAVPDRARVMPLLFSSVSVTTRRRYAASIRQFLRFLRSQRRHLLQLLDPSNLDLYFTNYMHHLYWLGRAGGTANSHRSAIVWGLRASGYQSLARVLADADHALKAFRRLRAPQTRQPVPVELAYSLASLALGDNDIRMAATYLFAFYGMLRRGEGSRVVFGDLMAAKDTQGRRQLRAILPLTKTFVNMSVTVDDPLCVRLVTWLLRRCRPTSPLAPVADEHLQHRFKRDVWRLGLRDDSLTFHGMRHGGATAAHECGFDMGWIAVRGRWMKEESARRYVKPALLTRFRVQHSALCCDWVDRAVRLHEDVGVQVPAVLWSIQSRVVAQR